MKTAAAESLKRFTRKFSLKKRQNDARKEEKKSERTVVIQDGVFVAAIAALLIFSAAARGVNLLLALGAMFVGFLALDFSWGAKTLKKLRATRKLPDSIFVDEPFYVEVELDATERSASAWSVAVEDEWAPEEASFDAPGAWKSERRAREQEAARLEEEKQQEKAKVKKRGKSSDKEAEEDETQARVAAARREGAETLRPVVYFPSIRKGEKIREYYVGVMTRRGRRRLDALKLSTRFPCGFFRSERVVDAGAEAIVFPKIGALSADWQTRVASMSQETSAAARGIARIPDETVSIRDWRPGDAKRTIAWRATAKRGKLQTREFARRQTQAFVVVLDLYDPEPEKIADDPQKWLSVEKAVSFVATLAGSWTAAESRLEFALNAAEEVLDENGEPATREPSVKEWNDVAANGSTRRVLTRLALARPTSCDVLHELLDVAAKTRAQDARIFVVSHAPNAEERLARARGESAIADERPVFFIDASSDAFDQYFQFERT